MKHYDFAGYATKNNLKCSDGRVIKPDAFKHQDGITVPLVWQHNHSEPSNVLGHAVLENRKDGVYAYCNLNETRSGKNAGILVKHRDIKWLSIYANRLKENASDVIHGYIREVSLVLTGANPGALIDNLSVAHGDGEYAFSEEEAIIYTGVEFELASAEDKDPEKIEHSDSDQEEIDEMPDKDELLHADEKTIGDMIKTMSEDQKLAMYAIIAQVLGEGNLEQSDEEGENFMKQNVFDQRQEDKDKREPELTHAMFAEIVTAAKRDGSMKQAFFEHAGTYGIDNIDYLFPDAKTITPTPDWYKRPDEWVAGVLNGVHASPFSRIKTVYADITADEARAKGYVTADLKAEEVFGMLKRVTTPQTIYKKQKLDRDDIIDITDFDVVAWMKAEMRMMLDEEVARAILVGDGRSGAADDKIVETNIRPIWVDDEVYSHHVQLASTVTDEEVIDEVVKARQHYRGSGNPILYMTTTLLTTMMLSQDTTGRRIYKTEPELASAMRVSRIVEVPVMDGLNRTPVATTYDLMCILVNLRDYTVGADKGGKTAMFDDFDIDYNQYKYLLETRISGALIRPKSAIVIEREQAA